MTEIVLDGEVLPISVQCSYCKHYITDRTCEAFPDGIPDVIWNNEIPHSKPFEGDHDIQYEAD